MPVPSQEPRPAVDPTVELAALRRRAYGPNPDIDTDATARARLQELEEHARDAREQTATASPLTFSGNANDHARGHAVPDASPDAEIDGTSIGLVASDILAPEEATSDDGSTDPAEEPPAAEPGPTRLRDRILPLLRQRRTWIIGGVGAVIGAVLALGLAAFPWSPPDQVLHREAQEDADRFLTVDYADFLRQLGIDRETLQRFEEVRGFRPWTADLDSGGRCLLLTQGSQSLVNLACSGAGREPVLDLLPGLWGSESNPSEPGSAIRFAARGDTVEVWFSGPQPTRDSAAVS